MSSKEGIITKDVEVDGIAGKLFHPDSNEQYPGIIVLDGSGGGIPWAQVIAQKFALNGYAALALAYFKFRHLPETLKNIPLEYFETAINWIKKQPNIKSDKLAVVGSSRGGELALILGSTFHQIKIVVAYAPSAFICGASGGFKEIGKSAWTHSGRPLPYIGDDFSLKTVIKYIKIGLCMLTKRPIIPTNMWWPKYLKNKNLLEKTAIPVEKIKGPILLISGQDDKIWPSSLMSEMIINRLKKHNHPYPYKHLSYKGAGHIVDLPDLPPEQYAPKVRHPKIGFILDYGGNPKNGEYAAKEAWKEVLKFLKENTKE
jgi:dienelactone hydrolase